MAAGEGSWMDDIQNKVIGLNPAIEAEPWGKQSIYRVPKLLKDLNRKAYKPQVVSFGPYHHGDGDVKPMEEHKQRALLHFLKRAGKPVKDFVSGMKKIVQQLQDSYQDLDQRWRRDRDRFLQLMIVDGCFMLELIRVAFGRVNDYSPNDPIFSYHGILYNLPHIHRDMLMVENQLPLLVLSKLVAVESGNIENEGQINNLVLQFLAPNETTPTPGSRLGLHPLDLYRQSRIQLVTPSQSPPPREPSYFPKIIRSALELQARIWKPTADSRPLSAQDGNRDFYSPGARFIRSVPELLVKVGICKPAADSRSPSPGIIRSARELDEAGIEFKKSETESLQDITFHDNVLSLPKIAVDDSTEYVFLNLMAFERLQAGVGNEVTSYVFFMDDIIESTQDVSLLRSKGIIKNDVGSDETLANIFNALSKEAVGGFDPGSNLNEVNRKLNNYCKKKRNRWRANLIRTYFRSPWSLLSLLAAIFLLALTFAQTLYTILAYYYR